MGKLTYENSGVDINKGDRVINSIKENVKSTYIPGVLNDLGGFAGLFEIKNYKEPVLVSGTDGVGTKLKVAIEAEKYDTIGIDLVAMCVNDILTCGAKPLFFLDYVAIGKLEEDKFKHIISGISKGCIKAGCALLGGETAEMPGMYRGQDFDVAGFALGACEKSRLITGKNIKAGDIILGFPSSGFHSNGYSLLRKLFFEKMNLNINDYLAEEKKTVQQILLNPTKIYVKEVLEILKKYEIKGMSHITGGGLEGNISRIIPQKLKIKLDKGSLPYFPGLKTVQKHIEEKELFKVFNMGIGFTLIVEPGICSQVEKEFNLIKIGEVINQ
ncbi:MAG: phosphoribosylformylglycinamidine cyclo-ligase [Candidatus Muiribacteriota bacterium]